MPGGPSVGAFFTTDPETDRLAHSKADAVQTPRTHAVITLCSDIGFYDPLMRKSTACSMHGL